MLGIIISTLGKYTEKEKDAAFCDSWEVGIPIEYFSHLPKGLGSR